MLSPADELYLERAYELAKRALGSTAPNPVVGAALVRDDRIVGEGYHHRAGEPHAEVNAIREAGERARGATLYVSLEPCNHFGRTPPCSHAVVDAGIARVVIGAADPNPKTNAGGIAYLREHGIDVEIADAQQAQELIAPFARAIRGKRPFVSLKMAMSLDGRIASQPGQQEWLTGEEARAFVRDLRIQHDTVAVGAGTIRVDDPQLTVRPAHDRARPYVRAVFCETDPVDAHSRVFQPEEGYAKTLVLAPAGAREKFKTLESVAELVFVGDDAEMQLDLNAALSKLFERGVTSVLCEGGPTMAGNLLRGKLVDRVHWLIAPRFLHTPQAVPVIVGEPLGQTGALHFTSIERLGTDVLVTGTFDDV